MANFTWFLIETPARIPDKDEQVFMSDGTVARMTHATTEFLIVHQLQKDAPGAIAKADHEKELAEIKAEAARVIFTLLLLLGAGAGNFETNPPRPYSWKGD